MKTLAILLGSILAFAWAAHAAERDDRPNIVFILADDLGINDLDCYGRKEHRTPHLDRLAAQGMRFTSAYCAQPICSPSRAAIMTGRSPARLRLTTFLPGRADAPSQKLLHPKIEQQLPLAEKTLAEYLKDAGYATACVGKWHLGGKGFLPTDQGFDVYFPGQANTKPSDAEGGKGEYALTRRAIEFIDQNKDKPFFLYIPHNTPHIPLAAKTELVEKYKNTFHPTYAAMMQSMDECVGMILARLDELKLGERTIVIFTSDNGGLHVLEFPGTPATHNTPFRAGKGFLYEGGLRVPAIVRWPGRVPAGKTVDVPMVNSDWLPTLLELCGVKARGEWDGISIANLLKGGEMKPRPFFWHFPHYTNQGSRPAGALRDGRWKFIEHYDDGQTELYDLESDVGEELNLAKHHPERIRSMTKQLADWRKAMNAQENVPNPAFDAARYKALYQDVDVSRLKPAATAGKTAEPIQAWRAAMNAAVRKPGG